MHEETNSVHDYIDVIYRKKWLIVLIFSCVFLATLYLVQKKPQRYVSSAKIYLESVGTSGTPTIAELTYGGRQKSRRSVEFYLGVFSSSNYRRVVYRALVSHAVRLGMSDREAAQIASQTLGTLEMRRWRYEGYYLISVQSPTPDIAHAADSIATYMYVDQCRIIATEESQAMARFVEVQFDSARENLRRAEESLQEFRRRNNFFPMSSGSGRSMVGMLPVEYQRLIEIYYDARRDRQTAQAALEAAIQNTQLLRSSLDTLGRDWITRANPQRELSQMQDLARKSQTELKLKEFQERSFWNQLREYEQRHPELTEIAVRHMKLVREREIYSSLASSLIGRREELRLQAGSETGGVRIIDDASQGAIVPTGAATTLGIGAALGLIFGIGVAFLWEMMDPNIKTASDVVRITGMDVIGTVPRISVSKRSGGSRRKSYAQRSLLISESNPRGPIAEAYRTLRTSLLYSATDKNLKTLVVSSPGQSEGKSLTAANLAITCAQMGQKTLLIDGDLRRPVQHMLLGTERDLGLSEFILQDLELSEVIKSTGVENLDLMTSGITPPNPAPMLASEAMTRRLAELESEYDLIFIDSPPVIAVTDPVLLGRMGDGMILVVRCAATPRAAVQHATGLLTGSQVPVLGTILNDVDVSRHYGGYHYYYYYYHYYSGYYGSDSADKDDVVQGDREGSQT